MIEPLVAAFSASCSANGTVAPRPATSAGSRAARVTTGPAGAAGAAWAAPAVPVTRLRPTADAAATVAQRGGAPVRVSSRNIDRLFLEGAEPLERDGRRAGAVTISFL